ncbi:MAG: 2,4-dienoyl-CoA reductase-like NADH-dependent reductase (Old Yellow Enzyme family) [Myxococcota bacterium]|jgi:2,4-dienoyl-CoA reductase-like NADH-dependent reductase (Old Yellow Enzyme family)
MWRPPERIKHPLPEPHWPDAEQAQASMLFSPIGLSSGLTLNERTWVPAMVPWRATDGGEVTPELLEWYGRFADARPGAIVVEATGIRDVPSGPLLRAGHDRFEPGLKRLVETVRHRSQGQTRLLVQLIDFLRIRRRPSRTRYLTQFLRVTPQHASAVGTHSDAATRDALLALDDQALERALSPREWQAMTLGERERVTDIDRPWIAELPRVLPGLFADAAQRAQRAGFDGVELHYAHAYTMASFLSALNDRSDGYGGSREARIRLPLEVYQAVRSAVGPQFTVGCRFLCHDIIEGGSDASDASWFGVRFARAGMDYLSLSTGGKFEDARQPKIGEAVYPYTGQSGYECMPSVRSDARGPFGRNVSRQAQVRAAIRAAGLETPVAVAGGIGTFAQAEAILQSEQGDIIAAARQSIADPDWWAKMRAGRGNEIRRCIYTNYCEALDQKHQKVVCQLWGKRHKRLTAPPWDGA